MAVRWTKNQQRVIDLRDRNILVSAAAGSGKTAVLVERIITRITDPEHPLSVDELLVVTFTRAAAAEMRERIRLAIDKALEADPENEHLRQQSVLIHNAQITTIDSFCLSVVQDHFHEIDLNPGFRTADEGELKLLKRDVMQAVLEDAYEEGDQDFLDFAASYGAARNDDRIADSVISLYDFSRSNPEPEEWLQKSAAAYEIGSVEELEAADFVRNIVKTTKLQLSGMLASMESALEICYDEGLSEGVCRYFDTLCEALGSLHDETTYAGLYRGLNSLKYGTLRFKKDADDEWAKERLVRLRDEVKELIEKRLKPDLYFQSPEEMVSDIQESRRFMTVLLRLIQDFADKFSAAKADKNMLDFTDMEHFALDILSRREDGRRVPSATAEEYQQQFKEIMIDEYQDSNFLQEAIFDCISTVSKGVYNVFMVGDVKQSIYRFRLARPDLFVEKYETYTLDDGKCQRIDLNQNFRSRESVLAAVNYIFQNIMYPEIGGIRYDESARLNPGADYPEDPDKNVEMRLIDTTDSGQDKKELEALYIAQRIRGIVGVMDITDGGETRKARYSDIVILMRGIKNTGDLYARVLGDHGVPAFVTSKEGYFSTREIRLLLDFLRLLDNSRQDIPLASVLLSPLGGMTEEDLAVIRAAYEPDRPFCECVYDYADNGTDAQVKKKLDSFIKECGSYREKAEYLPIHELLYQLVTDSGFLDFVSVLPGGEQRRANVEMLIEKAKSFDTTSYNGMFHFIRYIEQMKKYELDLGEAGIHDENADTVRIMTIHKSKGLEFPIVFVAGSGQKFNTRQYANLVQADAALGIGLDYRNADQNVKGSGLLKQAIVQNEKMESLGEELRVLYVALTRAKEKLIITGTCDKLDEKINSYKEADDLSGDGIPFYLLKGPKSYLDILLPCVLRDSPENGIDTETVSLEELLSRETEEFFDDQQEAAVNADDQDEIYSAPMRRAIEEQFDFQYPYHGQRYEKVKFTVSELKKRSAEDEEAVELYHGGEGDHLVPQFISGEAKIQGAARGTAYHRVMELWDFSKPAADSAEVWNRMQEMAACGRIGLEEIQAVAPEDILKFLETDCAAAMQTAAGQHHLYKEQPFVLGLDAGELYKEDDSGDIILVQGIIDAYYEDEDGITILDYKTDRVRAGRELTDKYSAQLDYYQKAVEQITEKKVTSKIIYSFTLGEEIRC